MSRVRSAAFSTGGGRSHLAVRRETIMFLLALNCQKATVRQPHWMYELSATNGQFPAMLDDGLLARLETEAARQQTAVETPSHDVLDDLVRCYNT